MLWRLHLKPQGNNKSHLTLIERCIKKNIAALGWAVPEIPTSLDHYATMAKISHPKGHLIMKFANVLKINDLIWTRSPSGSYYLGRVDGEWTYSSDPTDVEMDITNQRSCAWVTLENEEYVPGKIQTNFIRGQAFRRILGAEMEQYSKWLYNSKNQSTIFKDVEKPVLNQADLFFKFISPEDCEDVVGLYLQRIGGYVLLPSSCKKDTVGYEYILKHPDTGRTAVAQVKLGDVHLDDALKASADEIYLFSTESNIQVDNKKFIILNPEELFQFVLKNKSLLPARMKYWLA